MGSLSSAELSANECRRTNNFTFLIALIRKGWLFKRQFNSFKYLFNNSSGIMNVVLPSTTKSRVHLGLLLQPHFWIKFSSTGAFRVLREAGGRVFGEMQGTSG